MPGSFKVELEDEVVRKLKENPKDFDTTQTLKFKLTSKLKVQKLDDGDADPAITADVTVMDYQDSDGDIIQEGAFDEWIREFEANGDPLRMLRMHARDRILGEWNKFEIDDLTLKGTGKIYADVMDAQDAYALLQRGMLAAVSIGGYAKEYSIMRDDDGRWVGVRYIKMVLTEVSLVDFPANDKAQITSVKMEDGQIDIRKLESLLTGAGLSRKEAKNMISKSKDIINIKKDDGDDDEELTLSAVDMEELKKALFPEPGKPDADGNIYTDKAIDEALKNVDLEKLKKALQPDQK